MGARDEQGRVEFGGWILAWYTVRRCVLLCENKHSKCKCRWINDNNNIDDVRG